MHTASANMVTSVVEPNGEVHLAVDQTDRKTGSDRRQRVSATAEVRFPITTVEKQPERMIVIGDVHGDIGKDLASERGLTSSDITCTPPDRQPGRK